MANSGQFSLLQFSKGNFSISQVATNYFPTAMTIRGKFGKATGPDVLGVHGIYQMRYMRGRKQPLKMKFYQPTNPRSVSQQANRHKFRDAMAAWSALTNSEKTVYIQRAKSYRLIGYNLFVRDYMNGYN